MKRFLNKSQHQLNDWEKENLWRNIQVASGQGEDPASGPDRGSANGSRGSRRSSLIPAVGITLATTLVVTAILWQSGISNRIGGYSRDRVVWRDRQESVNITAAEQDPSIAVDDVAAVRVKSPKGHRSGDSQAAPPPPKVQALEIAPDSEPVKPKSPQYNLAEFGPAPVTVGGRIVDRETSELLAHANVLIKSTTRGVVADSSGTFQFGNLQPGDQVTLRVLMMGYAPLDTTVTLADNGLMGLNLSLEPLVVETLQAFDVEGAEYMVEVTASATKHVVADCVAMSATPPRQVNKSARTPVGAIPDNALDGSVTGGTTPPNGETFELMYFDHAGVNPFLATEDDALSTFAVDVDHGSYTLARNYLRRGVLPDKDGVRVEEFVNYFDAGLPQHTDDVFHIHADGGPSRFGAGYHMLRVGLQGKSVVAENRKPANLIFVVDISGSMSRENRLGQVRKSLKTLLSQLTEGDRVGIVVYGSRGEVRLEPTDISRREVILAAINGLQSAGSTNAAEGLELAYKMARRDYQADQLNRLILCSDGVANAGASTEAGGILDIVRKATDEGITLSTIGFGMGNYNDQLMEKLADQGDGAYYYVDTPEESDRVFKENLTGLLQTIAREVKVQVEFDPQYVARWRLLGYENRDVADRDFRNDDIDAGEVGAGHQVVALYELKLIQSDTWPLDEDHVSNPQLGVVRLRHEAPTHDTARAGQVTEISEDLHLSDLSGDFAWAPVHFRLQAVVAEFAEILRGSFWAKESRIRDLVPVADGLAQELPDDAKVQEFAKLVRLAAELEDKD